MGWFSDVPGQTGPGGVGGSLRKTRRGLEGGGRARWDGCGTVIVLVGANKLYSIPSAQPNAF